MVEREEKVYVPEVGWVYLYVSREGDLERVGEEGTSHQELYRFTCIPGLLPKVLISWGKEEVLCDFSHTRAIRGRVFDFAVNGVGETR